MAKQLNTESANEPAKTSNRNALIQECAQDMLEIKRQRAELNEQAADIRERLRDAGVQTRAFDYALRVQQMEQEARDEYMDSLRESFGALGIGGQLNFLDAAESEQKGNGAG